jgi:RecA/RadA recombinase
MHRVDLLLLQPALTLLRPEDLGRVFGETLRACASKDATARARHMHISNREHTGALNRSAICAILEPRPVRDQALVWLDPQQQTL